VKSIALSCALLTLVAVSGPSVRAGEPLVPPSSTPRVDHDAWTAVTMARNGSWGVGTSHRITNAITRAIRDCQAMAGAGSDCGAEFTTIQHGWSIALHCGQYRIIVTGETLHDVRAAVNERKLEMKYLHAIKLAPCQNVVLVEPSGHPNKRFVVSGF
jgi:hypothetical protein